MDWQEVLTLLVPTIGMMAYFYNRLEKKAEERFAAMQAALDKRFDRIDERFKEVDKRFKEVDQRLKEIDLTLQSLDRRLTRLEGRFDERGYWEAREWRSTGTGEKKQ